MNEAAIYDPALRLSFTITTSIPDYVGYRGKGGALSWVMEGQKVYWGDIKGTVRKKLGLVLEDNLEFAEFKVP